ncbi:hypothetical protein ACFWFI_13015 [Streptomyces sp. NPDC060209]|uniref:hypothetical protein n=1 Tax=Streptomyces sp. NPDC060209 TaxID=3347073 RepID=UPI00365EE2A6
MGETYLCSGASGRPTSWYANLLAHPDFTFHLKHGIRADLAARATPVTGQEERRRILTEIVTDLNQPHNPGTIAQPTHVRDWLNSRLARIDFL